ncbi:hypothetical protein D1872_329300 [compost metagenome]
MGREAHLCGHRAEAPPGHELEAVRDQLRRDQLRARRGKLFTVADTERLAA